MSSLDFERFFELSPDLLCIASTDGRLIRVNAAFHAHLGWSPDELAGRPLTFFIHPDDVAPTAQEEAQVAAAGGSRVFQNRYRGTDGGYRLIRWTSVLDAASGLIFATGRDITELHSIEQRAQAQQQRFQALIERSADLIVLLGTDASLQYLSPAFETVLGYSVARWLGQPVFGLIWPDDLQLTLDLFTRSMESPGAEIPWQLRLRHADGTSRWLEGTGINYIDDPATGGIVINCRDITERKRAEEALRSSSDLLARLAQQVPGVIYQFRLFPDGRSSFPFASEAIRDIYEVTPEEVREDASLVFSRLHPEDFAEVSASITRSANTLEPWRCDYRVILPRQGVRWRSGHARPQREEDGSILWHGFITDSTERKEAQRALEESEQRFRIQIEHAPEAIVVFDADHERFVDANENALRLFGLSGDELMRRNVPDLSPPTQPDGRPSAGAAVEKIREALVGGTPVFEWVHRNAGGRDIACEVRLVRLPSAGRNLVRGSITDITDRKQAEEELLRKEAAIASSINGIAMSDLQGKLTYVNRAFLDLWGYDDAAAVLGRSAVSFWGTPERAEEAITEIRKHGSWSGELIAQRTDAASLTLQVNASVFTDTAGKPAGMLASFLDLTESKRLQAQLLQAQKMESVGRLAGGVAHDFNNLLTVMKGYLELALIGLDPGDPLHDDLVEAERAADSAASLTGQLLAFSRKQIIDPRVLSLNDIVLRVQTMLHRILGEDIELRTVVAPDLGRVRFDPGQGEQILLNLAINARDAMPNGGSLTLETANVLLDEDDLRSHPGLASGEYVLLAVTDTGSGMSEEVKSHLFEPFFTTKAPGTGTGLGLAMIYGAVSQNGGRIEVDSKLGQGTTFRIYLPRVQDAAVLETPHAVEALPRGEETILLVEDEEKVRSLAARLLQRQGYRVLPFSDGPAAIEAVRKMTEPLHLLLTDVVMPVMNGRRLSEEIRALRPEIRVLFTSGYAADVILQHGVLKEGVEFLPKPYSIGALARRVREVLDKPSA